MTGAPVTDVMGRCHPCQGAPDMDDTPRTTIRTVIDPSPPPVSSARSSETGGGDFRKLIFTSTFTATECGEAARLLGTFPRPRAQEILNALDGRMRQGGIRSTPPAYLHGLIIRADVGTVGPAATPWTSCVSITIAESLAPTTTPVQPSPLAYPDVTTHPLCQRVAKIQEKVA